MFVKRLIEGLRILLQSFLLIIQSIVSVIVFMLLVIPPLIYEWIMKPKTHKCKKHKCDLIPTGYPDEFGFQKYRCPECGQ